MLLLALMGSPCAHALSIAGLRPASAVNVHAVKPRVENGSLRIGLETGGAIRINDWPAYLPQRFPEQDVVASSLGRPAGPISTVSLAEPGRSPWLVVGSGTRPAGTLHGGWHLVLAQGEWWAQKDARQIRLAAAGPGVTPARAEAALLQMGAQRWCFYLLESRIPPPSATEQEPQIAWAMIRLAAKAAQCPASW